MDLFHNGKFLNITKVDCEMNVLVTAGGAAVRCLGTQPGGGGGET